MNGILIVDKPKGLSSAQTVARVKRLLKAARVGHAGTLDPFAHGVLVCCLNQATRLAQFLLHDAKSYDAVMTLGTETDTQDPTGNVVGQGDWTGVTAERLQNCLQGFVGTFAQTPPVFSALKHGGVPLYTLARRGQPVQKPPRTVRIDRLRLLEMRPPQVRLEVRCSAGTYVRTLCADIGRALGCGAHVSELTRTESGGFRIEQALSLTEVESLARQGAIGERLIPMAQALPGWPVVTADPPLLEKIRHGRQLAWAEMKVELRDPAEDALLKVVDEHGDLVAVLRYGSTGRRLEYGCVVGPSGRP
ncbi:MAG: tRNA pseudouridine(55) synthase TruB [Desulfobacterales bacterium]